MKLEALVNPIIIVVAALLSGCAPKISSSISLPIVSVGSALPDIGKGAMVFVEEVKDSRSQKAIGEGPQGPIEAVGDVPAAVRETLESFLRKSGYSVTDSAPTIMQVELNTWKTVYYRGELNAQASLTIQVFDPGNKLAYSGSYQGSASVEGGSLDDFAVKDSLAIALLESIEQMSRDKQLMSLLASF